MSVLGVIGIAAVVSVLISAAAILIARWADKRRSERMFAPVRRAVGDSVGNVELAAPSLPTPAPQPANVRDIATGHKRKKSGSRSRRGTGPKEAA